MLNIMSALDLCDCDSPLDIDVRPQVHYSLFQPSRPYIVLYNSVEWERRRGVARMSE